MARSLWNGVISFGMVSIPISLGGATREKDLAFNQIHEVCGSRIKLQKFCPVCERVVTNEELVKGYEYAKGRRVIMTEEDFEKLPVPTRHAIEVVAFVDEKEIDPLYYDKSYYVEPEETGMKPYALLAQALQKKGKSALAKIAVRSKESLCVLRFSDGRIILETLFYPDEIQAPTAQKAEDIVVGEKEMDMALSLIDLLSEKFEPEKYKDEYRAALLEIIETKAQGGEIREAPEAAPMQVIDLMDALKASLDAAKEKRKSG